MRPLNRQARSQVPYSSLGSVVRGLRLRHVHDCAGHGSDHDDASWRLALHQMPRDTSREQVRPVDIDTPEFLDSVIWIFYGVEVLGEAGRGNQVVDLTMLLHNLGNSGVDRVRVRNIGVMRCDLRDAADM